MVGEKGAIGFIEARPVMGGTVVAGRDPAEGVTGANEVKGRRGNPEGGAKQLAEVGGDSLAVAKAEVGLLFALVEILAHQGVVGIDARSALVRAARDLRVEVFVWEA